MDAKELKEYIIENNLIQVLLEKVGCHSFVPYDKELRCALPNDNDNSKVSVFYNDNLSIRVFTKGETVHGSIYDLIMFIDESTFKDAIRKCQSLLGVSIGKNDKKKTSHISFYKRMRKKRENKKELNEYDKDILCRYSEIPHISLIKDGIFGSVLKEYSIMFDERTSRIVFPHFKYNDKNKILGLVGRTVLPAYKELNIPKYFPVDGLKYEKSRNLYGLSHNLEEIKRAGQVIVFESEKSVLKAAMMKLPYSVAIGSHDISDFQKKLLISLNVEIIIAFDKDVESDHISKIVSEISKYRKVSYIEDKWNLLSEKDSPVDKGYKKFNFLMKHRKYS
jgi:DNA primase